MKPRGVRYRGVTKHKRTQRHEAHIWCEKKQIYLGGFDTEELAAKSHDIMALRCKGIGCDILNFPVEEYGELVDIIPQMSREDIITALRNYSKSQTAKKAGLINSPSATGLKGGVQKVSKTPRSPRRVPPSPRKLVAMKDSYFEDQGTSSEDEAAAYTFHEPAYSPQFACSFSRRSVRGKVSPRVQRISAGKRNKEEVGSFDVLNLDGVMDSLLEDGSLTFSASADSLLYEATVVDATHQAVEHLNGAVLLQETPPQSPRACSPPQKSLFPDTPAMVPQASEFPVSPFHSFVALNSPVPSTSAPMRLPSLELFASGVGDNRSSLTTSYSLTTAPSLSVFLKGVPI